MFKALWSYADCLSAEQGRQVVLFAHSLPVEEVKVAVKEVIDNRLWKGSVRWKCLIGQHRQAKCERCSCIPLISGRTLIGRSRRSNQSRRR